MKYEEEKDSLIIDKKESLFEQVFERGLWSSRFLVLFAVLFSLIGALVLFIIASVDVFHVVVETWGYYMGDHEIGDLHARVVGEFIGAIDLYLIAVVMLIFSFGLYELFVSDIDCAKDHKASQILEIHSLDELKDKLAKVIVMVLVVSFFQKVLTMEFSGPLEMLYLAGSILGLSLALYFLHKGGEH